MKNVISVKGRWNRNETISYTVAIGTADSQNGIAFQATERREEQTTPSPVEDGTEREYFQTMFAGQADEVWVSII